MKRMLINATQQEELRIALVDGQRLYDLDIESVGHEQKKANIYKGTITKINPSLEAAFVAYGGERDGFLPLKEIAESYFPNDITGRRSIKHLKEGQEVLIQIEKEIRGKKGAALTTYISLAGSYLVLMPNDPRAGGVSRRIEGEDRADLKRIIDALEKPRGMGVIARTAGVGKTQEELQQDLDALINYWKAIQTEAQNHPAPSLIHKESDVITRAFRDYLRDDVGEILIDNPKVLEIAKKRLVDLGRMEYLNLIKPYSGEVSLFSHYQIEGQIESAFQREVRLPSGGSIVIDVTEALTAIDINSAKSIRGSDIEETAFNTNIEAADEIARQLRLRDLGGLIVIDFIDMTPIRNQREVENRLKEAMKTDRARIQTARISRFGLLELSRQRLSPSLREATHHICPRCQGTGTVRDNNSLSLSILRLIQEEVMKENTTQIDVIVPVSIASYLLNEKRKTIAAIENAYPHIKIVIAADDQMQTPLYKVIRKRRGEETDVLSYNLPKLVRELEEEEEEQIPELEPEQAILSGVKVEINPTVAKTKPNKSANTKPGMFSTLIAKIKAVFAPKKEEKPKQTSKKPYNNSKDRDNRRNNQRRNKYSPKPNGTPAVAQGDIKNQEPTKSPRRGRNNKNTPVATTEVVETVAPQTSAQTVTQTPKAEAKPRRAQRNLTKKVRLPQTSENTNTVTPLVTAPVKAIEPVQTSTEATMIIPSLLLPVVGEFATKPAHDPSMRRARRTSRHLRMNGQRRRRTKAENVASPMPLTMAVNSPELAMAKVSIDYQFVNKPKQHDTNSSFAGQNYNQVDYVDTSAQQSAPQQNVMVATLLMPVVVKTVAKAEQASKPVTTQTKVIESKPAPSEKEQVAVKSDVNPDKSGRASSMMTKAPAPESMGDISTVTMNYRDESNYQYTGKGNAGALSASNHAYSGVSKTIDE
ncbi:ribonuclease E [Orbaceae bacterium ac157xtp]